ncbi:MAG: diguanylate cyclase domain-containing protein [Vibrio sp.]
MNKSIQDIVFPNISQKFNEVSFNTQNQFDSLQYTSIREDYLTNQYTKHIDHQTADSRKSMAQCMDKLLINKNNGTFTNRIVTLEQQNSEAGVLLGKGKIDEFDAVDLNLLCTVLSTADVNSESIRLVKENPKLDSLYYFVAHDNAYVYVYNVSKNDSRFNINNNHQFNQSIDSISLSQTKNYWITEQYEDLFSGKHTTTFVKNIYDRNHNLRGFLVRDVGAHEITTLMRNMFKQIGIEGEYFDYLDIKIFNDHKTIYSESNQDAGDKVKNEVIFSTIKPLDLVSDFGDINIEVAVDFISLFKLILLRDPLLIILLPIFSFIFNYMFFLQLLRGYREGNKQYFDSLTPALNRNGLQKIVVKKVEKAATSGQDVHIFSVDANKFKQINDNYGHEMGDRAIQLIVSATRHICKTTDDIVRMGGDEFLVFLYMRHQIEFNADHFLERLNQKIAYDCKANGMPIFSVSAGHIVYQAGSEQNLEQVFNAADSILIAKKSVDKIATICDEFDSFDINLSDEEFDLKVKLSEKVDYIQAEHKLQEELNDKVLSAYHGQLNYLMSTYFQLMYQCNRTNDNLHEYRMKMVESHHRAGLPMSVFYFLFVKYANFLFDHEPLSKEELIVNNRVLSYELHFVSSLKMR